MQMNRSRARYHRLTVSLLWLLLLPIITILLYTFDGALTAAHENHDIAYFAADAPVYYEIYTQFGDENISENLWLLLNGFPVIELLLSNGSIFTTSIFNLIVVFVAITAWLGSFNRKEFTFNPVLVILIFPYLSLGFFSLNKEVFVMSSILLFIRYWLRGGYGYLFMAFVVAWMGRYHMAIVIIFLFAVFPRDRSPRIRLAITSLFFISIAAPFLKSFIPGYSSEGLIDQSVGVIMKIFIDMVDSYLYFIIYPFKFIALAMFRFYGVFVAANEDAANSLVMEAYISLLSVAIATYSFWLYMFRRRSLCYTSKALFLMGFLSPIPILWSDIGQWRYYSFTYFLFSAGLIVHFESKRVLDCRNPLWLKSNNVINSDTP